LHYPMTQDTQVPSIRYSQPLSTNQTPHPTTKRWSDNQPHPLRGTTTSGFPHSGRRDSGPVASKPNSVSDDVAPAVSPAGTQCLLCTRTLTHYR
jgi:hypothetical protein